MTLRRAIVRAQLPRVLCPVSSKHQGQPEIKNNVVFEDFGQGILGDVTFNFVDMTMPVILTRLKAILDHNMTAMLLFEVVEPIAFMDTNYITALLDNHKHSAAEQQLEALVFMFMLPTYDKGRDWPIDCRYWSSYLRSACRNFICGHDDTGVSEGSHLR